MNCPGPARIRGALVKCVASRKCSTPGSIPVPCRSRSGIIRSRIGTNSRAHFPADFIAEGVDQTRGWFYSLLAISTLLFDEAAYRAVVVNDLVLDEDGRKMSKSKGNVVDPWEALSDHGADAIRFYLLASSNPWLPKRWDSESIRETNRKLFDTLRSVYRFFTLYAGLEGWSHESNGARPVGERLPIDRWLLSRLDSLASSVNDDLEGYDLTRAARRLSDFVLDDLSNWYVRRNRERFWATRPGGSDSLWTADAFATLHETLATTAALLAPFAPFLSDWLYRELTGGSVHLADYPGSSGRRDESLESEMEDVRTLVTLGRAAREEAGIRVRQPLSGIQADNSWPARTQRGDGRNPAGGTECPGGCIPGG